MIPIGVFEMTLAVGILIEGSTYCLVAAIYYFIITIICHNPYAIKVPKKIY